MFLASADRKLKVNLSISIESRHNCHAWVALNARARFESVDDGLERVGGCWFVGCFGWHVGWTGCVLEGGKSCLERVA
jgi:hypothetical protein